MLILQSEFNPNTDSKVTVNCVLPGIVNTDLYSNMPFKSNPLLRFTLGPLMWFLMKTSFDGAQTPVYVALAAEEDGVTGKIYRHASVCCVFSGICFNERFLSRTRFFFIQLIMLIYF